MTRPSRRLAGLLLGVIGATLVPTLAAPATSALRVSAIVTPAITTSMPVIRLHFNAPVRASSLPRLVVRPHLATTWQQIGSRAVQAVVTGPLTPLTRYVVVAPTAIRCAGRCAFTATRPYTTGAPTNVIWEEQLLATLHYLPLTFTPAAATSDPAQPAAGTFTWAYPTLPARLSAQWREGADNVVLRGALMAFQNDHQLTTSGVADAATWTALVAAAQKGQVDTHPYDYVDVTESSPERLTLYVAGRVKYHALVNTGISVAPTSTGTYPVYLRFVNQIMRGTNPDGSTYADPVTWVSYFNGGDALHQFYRYSYGFPQSLGCVEMTLSDAKFVWPYTPIGTLVTVR